MTGSAIPPEEHIVLSLQRALLGAVTPNLRAVNFRVKEQLIIVVFVFAAPPSEAEVEAAQIVTTEMISDFPDLDCREEFNTLDITTPLPQAELERSVYVQKDAH